MPYSTGIPVPPGLLPWASTEPHRLTALAHVRRYGRGQDIYGPEELSDTWYRVVAGLARKYLMRSDGHRQLVDLYLPGDFFGFSDRTHHKFAVQAVADGTLIACYARHRVEKLAEEDPATASEIRMQGFAALARLEDQMMVIGTITAQEKVREFLANFFHRTSEGKDGDLVLPISRYDIADILGVSAETVSRAFTDLQERGIISLHGPRQVTMVRKGRE